MPRKTPTKYVETLGGFDAEPLEKIADYFSSKEHGQLFMKPPLDTAMAFDIASFYADAKIDRELTQKVLDALSQEQLALKKVSDVRLRTMKKDQIKLREGFEKLNTFARILFDKKKIASAKIAEEAERQNKLQANIEAKIIGMAELALLRDKLRDEAAEYQLYENVLDDAVKKSDAFESTEELITRCDAIMLASTEMVDMNDKLFDEIDDMRKRVIAIIKQAKLLLLGLKNLLIHLTHSYNAVVTECLRWERVYSECANDTLKNKLDKYRIWDGLHTVYRLLCKRSGKLPAYSKWPVEKILDFIQEEVPLLQATISEYNRRHNIDISVGIKKPKCN